jgi:sulfoxide reductase heme-binding subunit YedZ
MKPDKPPSAKQRLDDWARLPGPASPLGGNSAAPQAGPTGRPFGVRTGLPATGDHDSARVWGPSAPQGSRPGIRANWSATASPESGATIPSGGAAASRPAGLPPAGGAVLLPPGGPARLPASATMPGADSPAVGTPLLPAGRGPVSPLAAGVGAPPRTPSRTGAIYRGLPWPVRIAGWIAVAVAVGAVLGATGPTAMERIGAVAAIQPGLLAWYSVRALGFLAYFVLAASVLYGLLLSTKILDTIAHRPVSFALHKDLAIVAMILATMHGALLVFDQSFDFTPRSIIVPFASPYSPITVGIGQLTFYASFVVTASFYVRRHIGQRAWRILHYVTFLAFIGATFHGIASGSDSGSGWAFWVYLVPTTLSVFLLTYRIVVSIATRVDRSRDRRAGIPPQLGPARGPLDRPGAASAGF